MSDFDAQAVLRQVDENHTPAGWQVYRARKGYFYEQGCAFALIALTIGSIFVLIGFLQVASLMHNQAVISDPPSQDDGWLMILIPLLSLLLTIATAWEAIYQFSQLRTVGTHVFVLTPEGCVARTGPKPYQTYGVGYDHIAAITMSVEPGNATSISLTLTFAAGSDGAQSRVQWRINPQFKASDAIAQAVIEAHTRYAVTHAPTTAS